MTWIARPWLGLAVDVAEEVAEVHGPVAGGQLAGHLPGGGVQRGVSWVIRKAVEEYLARHESEDDQR